MSTDKGKVVVITGACGGMGRACIPLFAPRAKIIAVDIDQQRVDALAEEFKSKGHDVIGTTLDITAPNAAADLAKLTVQNGTPYALVHTAGLSPSMADPKRVMDVNLIGTQHLVDAFWEIAQPGFSALLVASTAAHMMPASEEIGKILQDPFAPDFWTRIAPFCSTSSESYAFSKWAVIDLCGREAARWGAKGARINSLSPGMIDTPMGRREEAVQSDMFEMFVKMTPLGRYGQAEEIATAVNFLCSEAASFITGIDLLVDGGIIPNMKQARAAA